MVTTATRLRIGLTADGAPALDALAAAVRAAKGDDPLAPVTVVVPTNTAGVLARRALGRAGGIAAVQFLTLFRLAELLGGPRLAEVRRAPLSGAIAAASVRAVLHEAPGRFAPVRDHPTTVAALVESGRELRELPPALVRRLGSTGSPLTAEVVRVHDAARRRTVADWHDEADLLDAALDALDAGTAARIGPVIWHLPERLPAGGVRLVQALAEHVEVVVQLPWSDDPVADRPTTRLAERLGLTLPEPPLVPERVVETLSVSDADEEVRAAVRLLVDAAQRGTPLDRMAVMWCGAEPYQRIVGEQLDAAGLQWNGPSPVRVAERLAGRCLLAVLDLDRFGFRRSDLFSLVGNAPIRDRRGAPVPSAAWERISRAAGVARGDDWAERLAEFAVRQRAAASEHAASGEDGRAAGASRDADHADRLAEFVAWLRDELGDRTAVRTWAAWGAWGHRLLGAVLARGDGAQRLPAAELSAFDRVEHALDRLGELDAVAAPPSRAEFRDALVTALDAERTRSGRIGDGVLVGGLSSAVGLTAELVVILGLVDGAYPHPPAVEPMLGDHDRHLVAPWLATAEDDVARQRRHLAAALAAGRRVVVGVPRGDLRRSCRRDASNWLAELVPAGPRHVHDIPSFTRGTVGVAFPATTLDHRLRALLAHQRGGQPVDSHPLAASDPALARGLRLVRSRAAGELTAFDGDLSSASVPSPFDPEVIVASTRLETWVSCPHRYFQQYLLRVPEPDRHDEQLRISALDRGNLLHTAIDRFLSAVLAGELPLPAPEEPWSAGHHTAAHAVLDEECERARSGGLTGRHELWTRDRAVLHSELHRWLVKDDEERAAFGLVPIASERSFGGADSDWPAAVVETPGGRTVRFRGSIDRLDRTGHGGVLVTDHKTGSASRFEKIKKDTFAGGSKLQLAAYAAAVAQAEGRVDPIGITAIYAFTKRGERIGYTITEEIWARFAEILEVIGSTIDAGLFPMRPQPPGFQLWVDCPYCDPDGLGTGESHRRWTAKQSDPRLRSYLELIGELTVEDGAS